MLHKYQTKLFISMALLLSVGMLAGCASTKATAETSGTGVVTESTMTDTVESSGAVSAYQLATLTWKTSGTVSEVDVKTNQIVKSGDVLMTLDSTTAPANIIQSIADLVSAQQALDYAILSKTSIAKAEVALASAKSTYNDALGRFYTLNSPVGSSDYITILKSKVLTAENKVEDAETNYNRYAEAASDDIFKAQALSTLAQARIDLKSAKANLSYYKSNPDTLDSATIQANLSLTKAQLDDAQRAYDLVKDGNNTDAITSAQAKVDAAQATVNSLSIIAPFDGEIAVVFSLPGDIVSQNTEAVILVNRSKLYVDVYIDETSISSVKVGNPVEVTFDAFDGLTAIGKVTLINPIGESSSGVVNYSVRVELDKSDPAILIGATANVTIQTGEPKSVLFVPVSAVLNDAQGEYVFRINNNGAQERVTVVSGQIVDDKVVVAGDLKVKDVVQLYSSSFSTTNNAGIPGAGGMFR